MQRSLSLQESEPEVQQPKVAELDATECELCVVDSPVYEMGRVCCMVRYIMHEPRLDVRGACIERWKRKDRAKAEFVEKEVSARWQMKKKK